MASILEFRKSAFRFRPSTERGASATADIVLFPGVRYERWEEKHLPEKPEGRRTRRRDRLDLDD